MTTRLATMAIVIAGVPAGTSAKSFDVAVTVDDLPGQGALPIGHSRLDIAHTYLEALRKGGVREAFGFVNAGRIAAMPDGDAVLDAWRHAGQPLGNHGFDHMNLARAPDVSAWMADVERGEPAVSVRMPSRYARFYRFPNLAEGRDPIRRGQAHRFLSHHNYRIAHVSLSFADWSYADAYARCIAQADTNAILAMRVDYMGRIDEEIGRMRAHSRLLYGRVPPQVLLTHLSAWGAATLPDLLARLKAAGARFVPLSSAMADPAYFEAERLSGGGTIVQRAARAKSLLLPEPILEPTVPRMQPAAYCR